MGVFSQTLFMIISTTEQDVTDYKKELTMSQDSLENFRAYKLAM